MAYNNAIPQPEDQMDQSQGQILGNFESLDVAIGINHYSFAVANAGKHVLLTFPTPSNITAPLVNEVKMGANVSPFTNRPEINYQNDPVPVSLTARQFPQQLYPGWAMIGGDGLMAKWGLVQANAFQIVPYPDDNGISIPRFQNPPYAIMLSPVAAGQVTDVWIRLVANQAAFFSVYASARTVVGAAPVQFQYLAIGN